MNLQDRICCRQQANGQCSKMNAPPVFPQQRWSPWCTQNAVGILVKQVKGKFWPRALMYVMGMLSILRANITFWSIWKKMIRKRRKPKKRVPEFSWRASLLYPDNFVRTGGRGTELPGPFPANSQHDGDKKTKILWTVKCFSWLSREGWCPVCQRSFKQTLTVS